VNEADTQLLRILQRGVPLVPRPWEALAAESGRLTLEVMNNVEKLHQEGILKRIGGVFDTASLGYAQTLAALRVPTESVDAAGEVLCRHPGVSHCYRRRDAYNLWFTLAVSPSSRLGLDRTADRLSALAGATEFLLLPSERRYKLHVRLDIPVWHGRPAHDSFPIPKGMNNTGETPVPHIEPPSCSLIFTMEQRRAVRALQRDLPVTEEPFDVLARAEGLRSGDDLLVLAADFLAAGWMRRYAAIFAHRQAGASANVLVAWRVEDRQADRAGTLAAQFPAVSHCYLRRAATGWPFNLYTMLHGPDPDTCRNTIEEIASGIGRPERRELWTDKEYKNAPVRLFCEEEARWEDCYGT
jgi:DNA-binding Lrp family transcriptional regulator